MDPINSDFMSVLHNFCRLLQIHFSVANQIFHKGWHFYFVNACYILPEWMYSCCISIILMWCAFHVPFTFTLNLYWLKSTSKFWLFLWIRLICDVSKWCLCWQLYRKEWALIRHFTCLVKWFLSWLNTHHNQLLNAGSSLCPIVILFLPGELLLLFTSHATTLQLFYGSLDFVWVSRSQKGKTKANLNFLEQETVSGNGTSWAICKSAPRHGQITTPTPTTHFLRAACPSCRPTNSVIALKANNDMWVKLALLMFYIDWLWQMLAYLPVGKKLLLKEAWPNTVEWQAFIMLQFIVPLLNIFKPQLLSYNLRDVLAIWKLLERVNVVYCQDDHLSGKPGNIM